MRKSLPSKSPWSELYQLHLDVERLAHALRERNQRGWRPLKQHFQELYDISARLKVLDRLPRARF